MCSDLTYNHFFDFCVKYEFLKSEKIHRETRQEIVVLGLGIRDGET